MERQKTTLAAYNELYKEQDDLYRGAARGFGLSDCAFWVLYALRETKRPMTQSGICAAVYQPKQTVHSALKKLEGEGYLRLAEGRDRRSKHLVLTERGEALVRRTVDPVMAAETAAMGALTETEQAQLLALQRRYNAALRQYLPQTGEREKGTERGADR